jgi:hypothetical protein
MPGNAEQGLQNLQQITVQNSRIPNFPAVPVSNITMSQGQLVTTQDIGEGLGAFNRLKTVVVTGNEPKPKPVTPTLQITIPSSSSAEQSREQPFNPFLCAKAGIDCLAPKKKSCPTGQSLSIQNNPYLTSNIHANIALGADAGSLAAGGGFIVLNIVGAPEVEGGEGVLGILELAKGAAGMGFLGAGVGSSFGIIGTLLTTPATCGPGGGE